ncbi:phage antirepressor N-terminal domain-containing protein [Actinocorallia longicatena]|uniref:Antirepressor protein ant N-terminal domain-containing protein n=1 Tax=Actinocorallia longicatena TaxID=111803 RepID=A0ABP6QE27_9ACTN
MSQPKAPTLRADVVAVPFLRGHIPAVLIDGEPHVILKPIADLLGINWASQYTKLSAAQWACIVLITTQLPGEAQPRQVIAVSMETFTVWLAGLQESRVSPDARETVAAYKREAGRALRIHFFGTPARIDDGDELAELELANSRLAKAITIAKHERAAREAAEAELVEAAPKVEAYDQMIDHRGLIPMAVFAQQSGIRRPNGRLLGERSAIEALREAGVLKDAPGTEQHNTPYQEHAHRVVTKSEQRGPVRVNVPYVVPGQAHYLARRIAEQLSAGQEPLPRATVVELRALGA